MGGRAPVLEKQFLFDVPGLTWLLSLLQSRGYAVAGPTIRGDAIVYDRITDVSDLPAGWTAEQEAGTYRLKRRPDGALFGYAVGFSSWKRFLHEPEVLLFEARQDAAAFRIVPNARSESKMAFLGVRCCDLAAIAIQDRVLLAENCADSRYRNRHASLFIVAVNCTVSAPTCFCASFHAAPPAEAGFDLALTELVSDSRHVFVVEAGTHAGEDILAELGSPEADAATRTQAAEAIRLAQSQTKRKLDYAACRETLEKSFDSAHWDQIASRCLSCGNCTMVCPTCFCTTVEDTTDLSGVHAQRWRRWDSCFSQGFSYIHGGSVRLSVKSRYRQWLMHKLVTWVDQFGSPGCVGCGRCITWCPAAIDLTIEAAGIQ